MLTAKQKELLLLIDERVRDTGVSPSFDEMKDALGLKSKSGIHRLIKALEERGFLRRLPNRARALEVLRLPDGSPGQPRQDHEPAAVGFGRGISGTPANDDLAEIPLHGRIAAGMPIEALENVDNAISVPANMLGPGQHFALEIAGDSMVDMGILDGDTIVVERCDTARDGDVVVALLDDHEATLKTLKRQGPKVELIPANPTHDTQVVEADRVRVQGRLIGLIRRY